MSEYNDGGPAFPSSNTPETGYYAEGMFLRDYFAAKAMQTHAMALTNWATSSQEEWHAEVARMSYMTADAMLKARTE